MVYRGYENPLLSITCSSFASGTGSAEPACRRVTLMADVGIHQAAQRFDNAGESEVIRVKLLYAQQCLCQAFPSA